MMKPDKTKALRDLSIDLWQFLDIRPGEAERIALMAAFLYRPSARKT